MVLEEGWYNCYHMSFRFRISWPAIALWSSASLLIPSWQFFFKKCKDENASLFAAGCEDKYSSNAEVLRYRDNVCVIKRKCLTNTQKTENRLDFKEQHMSLWQCTIRLYSFLLFCCEGLKPWLTSIHPVVIKATVLSQQHKKRQTRSCTRNLW